MVNIQRIKSDLRRDEGLRLKPYRCSEGKLTIGVGHRILKGEDFSKGISELEADTILINDIYDVIRDLDMYIPWWKNLSEVRQCAIINMGFNLGLPRLMKFRKMLRALRKRDFETAALEALDSKWARQVGNRSQRIAKLIREG